MLEFAAKRLGLGVLVILIISVITFILSHVAIDPAMGLAGDSATAGDIEAIRQRYGFDRPLVVQYFDYLGRLVQGDLGQSYLSGRPVSEMLAERFPATALLAILSIGFALAIAIPLGVLAALKPNTLIDRAALFLAVCGQAIPNFWAGLLLILLFGVTLQWLPISGSTSFRHFILPAIALGSYAMPALMRLVRAGMVEVLRSDYIRTARAMGIKRRTILFKYGLRNAILPVISLIAVQFGFMLGGSIVVESIFAINGIGYLAWQSMSRADMPVIQAIVLIISMIYVVLTLAADLLNSLMDPRIRINR